MLCSPLGVGINVLWLLFNILYGGYLSIVICALNLGPTDHKIREQVI